MKFSNRLKIIIDYYELSASSFAEKINVQRSSISHLLSGRNKPSLEFVLKVLSTFKEIEFYWLVEGKGVFPKVEKKLEYPTTLFSDTNNTEETLVQKKEMDNDKNQKEINATILHSDVEKIVIFYKNGTFKQYKES